MCGKENPIGVQIDPEEGLVSFFPYYRVFLIAKSGFWDFSVGVGSILNDPYPRGSFWEVTIQWGDRLDDPYRGGGSFWRL